MFKFIKSWLDRLTKENEKSFGNGKLDCCSLNHSKNPNSKTNSINNSKLFKNKQ
jgi:hypothetical protein